MKTHPFPLPAVTILLAASLLLPGCDRQTRGSADATEQSKAASPAEGGSSSTAGSAGRPESFGDIDAKRKVDEASPTGKSYTGGASTGPDYTLDSSTTRDGQPVQSKMKKDESNNASPRNDSR